MDSNLESSRQNLDEGRHDDEFLVFSEEEEKEDSYKDSHGSLGAWKILIVDDEPDVHHATRLALSDIVFQDRKLELLSAYWAEEVPGILKQHPDTAVILLDVVMEDNDAGLKLVDYIRNKLKNEVVRIILRTGQPGVAPEKKVILEYDINDYKEKTELTVQKLFTAIISALRTFQDMNTIENNRMGLEKIVESSSHIYQQRSMQKFSHTILEQLSNLLNLQKSTGDLSSCIVSRKNSHYHLLAATGSFQDDPEKPVEQFLPREVINDIDRAFKDKTNKYREDCIIIYSKTKDETENVIWMENIKKLREFDKYLLDVYCTNVSIALENIKLNEEVDITQREIIYTLGEIAENRSLETGYHVKRVAEYCKLLALEYGLPEEEAEIIGLAAPMHDIGKIGIPDKILNKPGKLTPEEFEIVKQHSLMGYEILKHSHQKITEAASIIAYEHHEKYDGTGYPRGLKGEELHIYGRIAAIADVFDALGNDRVYKQAWPLEEVLEYLKEEKGKHFDPYLVDLFLKNLDKVMEIKDKYSSKK